MQYVYIPASQAQTAGGYCLQIVAFKSLILAVYKFNGVQGRGATPQQHRHGLCFVKQVSLVKLIPWLIEAYPQYFVYKCGKESMK